MRRILLLMILCLGLVIFDAPVFGELEHRGSFLLSLNNEIIEPYLSDISIVIDGQKVLYDDAKPYISQDGRTMLPVRIIAENLGAKVDWMPQEREVVISKDSLDPLVLTIDKYYYYLKRDEAKYLKEAITVDSKTVINGSNGRTYVPLRFIGEYFGAKVLWLADTRTVEIATGEGVAGSITKADRIMVEDSGYRFEARGQGLPPFGNGYSIDDDFSVLMGTNDSSYEIKINTHILDNFEKQLRVTREILEQKYPKSVVGKAIELMKSKMYASDDIEIRTGVKLWNFINIPNEKKYIFVRSIATDGNIEIGVYYTDKKF